MTNSHWLIVIMICLPESIASIKINDQISCLNAKSGGVLAGSSGDEIDVSLI